VLIVFFTVGVVCFFNVYQLLPKLSFPERLYLIYNYQKKRYETYTSTTGEKSRQDQRFENRTYTEEHKRR
jgi:hypothetical protein